VRRAVRSTPVGPVAVVEYEYKRLCLRTLLLQRARWYSDPACHAPPLAVTRRLHHRGARAVREIHGSRSVASTDDSDSSVCLPRRAPAAISTSVRAHARRTATARTQSAATTNQLRRIERSGCGLRVAPRCHVHFAAASSLHVALPARTSSRAAGVRSGLRRVQGTREPTSPPPNPGLVPLRRTRDLVHGGSRH
jgi:hypothetical protein